MPAIATIWAIWAGERPAKGFGVVSVAKTIGAATGAIDASGALVGAAGAEETIVASAWGAIEAPAGAIETPARVTVEFIGVWEAEEPAKEVSEANDLRRVGVVAAAATVENDGIDSFVKRGEEIRRNGEEMRRNGNCLGGVKSRAFAELTGGETQFLYWLQFALERTKWKCKMWFSFY